MRVLLTGATGFIGRHLLSALLAEGHHVVCAVRNVNNFKHHPDNGAAPRVSQVQADFAKDTDKSAWLTHLHDVDVVINTVGIFRQSKRQQFAQVHVAGPRALFAACAESDRVRLVIQLSALGADDAADTPYHLSKKAADDYLASLPLRAFIVQPSLVYGKDGVSARAFRTLASLPLCPRLGTAAQLVQPIHIDDLVQALVSLVRNPLPVAPDPDTSSSSSTSTNKSTSTSTNKSTSKSTSTSTSTVQRIALVGPRALPFIDYLAALRAALGLGKLRVLRLPDAAAKWLANISRWLPGAMLDADALRMLNRGNHADPALSARLLGRMPRPVTRFIEDPAAERAQAKLGWLLPVLRYSIVLVWIATAIVSLGLYPVEQSYQLLERSGIPAAMAPLMLYGAAATDLLIGIGIMVLPRRRWLWGLQLALIGFYSLVIAWKLPEFLLHPYGPLTKNVPMLAAIWLLFELEEK